MPGLNKNRKRPITLAFRVSALEAKEIDERIKITGLPRGEYFIKTFLNQKIEIKTGYFESDRLSYEFTRIRNLIENLNTNDIKMLEALDECKSLLKQLSFVIADYKPQEKQEYEFNSYDEMAQDVEYK